MEEKDKEMNLKETAAVGGVHPNTVRRWIDYHGLKADQRGPKKTVIRLSDLRDFQRKCRMKRFG